MAAPFEKYELYTREQAAAKLAPDYKFKAKTGTWGLQGTIPFGEESNYAFFVTYGQKQAHHEFDEGVSEDGVLRWQSQPSLDFESKAIQEFIEHDETAADILLFLRPTPHSPYMFLGNLKYVAHDAIRTQPVHFLWRIVDFNPKAPQLIDFGIKLEAAAPDVAQLENQNSEIKVTVVAPPKAVRKNGVAVPTKEYHGSPVDYEERDRKNRNLGFRGEEIVIKQERSILEAAGRADLAKLIEHVSVTCGDSAGFDVKSFDPKSGAEIHIEVKTTSGPAATAFYVSANELAYATRCKAQYKLCRLFGLNGKSNEVGLFELSKDQFLESLEFTPISFRVRTK